MHQRRRWTQSAAARCFAIALSCGALSQRAAGQCETWLPVGGVDIGTISALGVYNDELIAGGNITINGQPHYLARWDGTAWQPLGSGLNGPAWTFAEFDGDLIVGGLFTVAGGQTAKYIARWDGGSWHPMGGGFFHPMGNTSVDALAVYNGELYAGGNFRGETSTPILQMSRAGTALRGSHWSARPAFPARAAGQSTRWPYITASLSLAVTSTLLAAWLLIALHVGMAQHGRRWEMLSLTRAI